MRACDETIDIIIIITFITPKGKNLKLPKIPTRKQGVPHPLF